MKLGSLDKAARKHHVSQSAVSQAIMALEKALELPLVSHERRVVRATDEGLALALHCAELLAKAASLFEAANELRVGYHGRITLGCTSSLAVSLLPAVLEAFRQQAPQVTIAVTVGNSEVLTRALVDDEVDLAVLVKDGKAEPTLTETLLGRGSYVVVKHRRERRSAAAAGLVVTRRTRPEVTAVIEALRQGGPANLPAPEVAIELISWEGIKAYLALGKGYGIMPDYVLSGAEQKHGLQIAPLSAALPTYDIIAMSKASKSASRNLQLMQQLFQLNVSKTLQERTLPQR